MFFGLKDDITFPESLRSLYLSEDEPASFLRSERGSSGLIETRRLDVTGLDCMDIESPRIPDFLDGGVTLGMFLSGNCRLAVGTRVMTAPVFIISMLSPHSLITCCRNGSKV